MTALLTPHFHPSDDMLLRFTAGSLSPAMHLLVAAHMELCPACRKTLQACEAEAGLALESLPPEELERGCLENLLSKIDEAGPAACIDVTIPVQSCTVAQHVMPDSLAPHAGVRGENIHWDYSRGFAAWVVPVEKADNHAQIYCLDAGHKMIKSMFSKHAFVLVLSGSFDEGEENDKGSSNHKGRVLRAGDMVQASSLSNTTTAGKDTLCLVVVPLCGDRPGFLEKLFSFVCGGA